MRQIKTWHVASLLIALGIVAVALWFTRWRQSAVMDTMGTPAARKFFEQGEHARFWGKGDWPLAAKDYRQAIDLDPNYVNAHEMFIQAMIVSHPKDFAAATKNLKQLYEGWAREHPNRAVYVWALGILCGEDLAKAETYYRKALARDPSFAAADNSLAWIAESRGDSALAREYLKKAMEANPREPKYLLDYAYSERRVNPTLYRQLSLEVVKRFPQNDTAAHALLWLAEYAPTPQERIADLERLKNEFPPSRFIWSAMGMEMLFYTYLQESPHKAWALAQQMATSLPDPSDRDEFRAKSTFAGNLVKAESLMTRHDYGEAEALLAATKAPGFAGYGTRYEVDRGKSLEGMGKTPQAYKYLLALVAHEPNHRLEAALQETGSTFGKTPKDVEKDVWRKREETSQPAKAFTLTNYDDGKPVSLASFRGQIVLLDFWFPACGPCRESFPYLQDVLEKYRGQKYVTLAINVVSEQDQGVVPFLKQNHYGFIPLKSNGQVEKDYGVRGEPTTFLIDGRGRIIFRPHVYDPRTGEILDLEVGELLAHETKKG